MCRWAGSSGRFEGSWDIHLHRSAVILRGPIDFGATILPNLWSYSPKCIATHPRRLALSLKTAITQLHTITVCKFNFLMKSHTYALFRPVVSSFANIPSAIHVDSYRVLQYCGMVQKRRLLWSRGSVLAFGTQVRGFKPGRSRRIFQGEKRILSTPSFGREVKPLSHVVDLRHVKDPWMLRGSRAFSGKIHRPFLAQVVPPFTTRVSGGDTWRYK